MEREPQRSTNDRPGSGAWVPGDLPLTEDRRAYLAARLADLMTELGKLGLLETPELEPAMTAGLWGSDEHGAA